MLLKSDLQVMKCFPILGKDNDFLDAVFKYLLDNLHKPVYFPIRILSICIYPMQQVLLFV